MEFKIIPNRPEYIWNIPAIFQLLDSVDTLLATEIDPSNGEMVAARIGDFLTWYPASNNALASAKWYTKAAYKMEYEEVVAKIKAKDLPVEFNGIVSASILKGYIEGRIAEFEYLFERAERTNKSITHAMDGLRSMLSNAKNERSISNYAQNRA